MKVEGVQIKTEKVIVDIPSWSLIDSLVLQLRSKIIPNEVQGVEEQTYIGKDGVWEGWSNGHGSGNTTVFRKASQEEIEAMTLISTFSDFAKRLLSGE